MVIICFNLPSQARFSSVRKFAVSSPCGISNTKPPASDTIRTGIAPAKMRISEERFSNAEIAQKGLFKLE